ncbi:MAG: DUF4835 family protein [Bacteroidetes bacterium]|nr:DUF4835 family protein [Bacteroidota bacterium]
MYSFNLKNIVLSFFVIIYSNVKAQDVDATITVIHPKIQISNTQIFSSLQASISQFLNQRLWSTDKITNAERFKMSILIDVTAYQLNSNDFSATIQIQATRPVFGSTYNTVLFNQLDEEFTFQYQEFQAMEFQQNANVYNLTGVLAFYVNTVLGLNYDTYHLEGGSAYYTKAREILNASQSIPGWKPNDGRSLKNRFYLIDNLTSERYKPIRVTLYNYHLLGLDIMHKDVAKGRDEIYKSLENFQDLAKIFPNSMLIKVFFNAKYKELVEVFKQAPAAEQAKAIDLLSRLDPSNKIVYDTIKT